MTREEFMETDRTKEENNWDRVLYECPKCGGGVKRDLSILFCTFPPKYKYFCTKCDYREIF